MANKNRLRSLYYHVTNRCNLRCKHCWVDAGRAATEGELTLSEAKAVLAECKALGLESVKLTGGEPFVVDWICDLVHWLAQEDTDVTIETNGTLIGKEVSRMLSAAGNVSHMSVSLDGSTAASHEMLRGVPGCFDLVLAGIRSLVEVGIVPSLMVAVHRRNLGELQDIGKLARSMGLKTIKLNCIHGSGRASTMSGDDVMLSNEEQLELFDSLADLEETCRIKFQIGIPMALRPIGKLARHRCYGCDIQHTLGLMPDGELAMCGVAITLPELRYGKWPEHSVADIWNNHPAILEMACFDSESLEGVCGKCIFVKTCRGGCRAEAYSHGGSLLSSGPMCEWARANGRFPIERLLRREEMRC